MCIKSLKSLKEDKFLQFELLGKIVICGTEGEELLLESSYFSPI